MEETTTMIEEQETPTETPTEQEMPTEEVTETPGQEQDSPLSSETIEALPDNSDNILHELYASLGVNLDYTPVNNYQCFTMALQAACAITFIWWFWKYLFSLMRSFMSSRW